ncbi:MAG: HNH endonuclease [Paludibacteraceae bacterium]|nr:HNH endonuclease [Paludibacteraceae bacterium]
MAKSKRTKACEIPPKVREEVERRDSVDGHPCCIFCGSPDARGEGHFIKRSQGGLGIPKNLVTVCRDCHREMDDGDNRKYYMEVAENYLRDHYPDWNKNDLIFKKGTWT